MSKDPVGQRTAARDRIVPADLDKTRARSLEAMAAVVDLAPVPEGMRWSAWPTDDWPLRVVLDLVDRHGFARSVLVLEHRPGSAAWIQARLVGDALVVLSLESAEADETLWEQVLRACSDVYERTDGWTRVPARTGLRFSTNFRGNSLKVSLGRHSAKVESGGDGCDGLQERAVQVAALVWTCHLLDEIGREASKRQAREARLRKRHERSENRRVARQMALVADDRALARTSRTGFVRGTMSTTTGGDG